MQDACFPETCSKVVEEVYIEYLNSYSCTVILCCLLLLGTVSAIPIVTVSTSAYIVNIDSAITLECQVTADPSHNSVYWQKIIGNNTETLTINGGKYSGSSVSNPSLTISNTQFSDAGSYYCNARNLMGTGSSIQIILAVVGTCSEYCFKFLNIRIHQINVFAKL